MSDTDDELYPVREQIIFDAGYNSCLEKMSEETMITIKQISNGCVVKFGSSEQQAYIFGLDNLSGLQEMMYDILEEIEPTNSRYSKQRLQVSIVHGDKYECKDKKCDICRQ